MKRRFSSTGTVAGVMRCALFLCLAACEQAPLAGPPDLKLGQQECGDGGVLINDDRCCCANLINPDGTRREHALFDDIGCMLEHAADMPDVKVNEHRALDIPARTWIKTESASFLMSGRVHTPKGSWIVAFGDRSAADAAREDNDGRVLTWDQVIIARREGWKRVTASGQTEKEERCSRRPSNTLFEPSSSWPPTTQRPSAARGSQAPPRCRRAMSPRSCAT